MTTIAARANEKVADVPTIRLAAEFAKDPNFDKVRYTALSKLCLIKPEEVEIYIQHLKQTKINRQRGVEKAKKTRAAKKQ